MILESLVCRGCLAYGPEYYIEEYTLTSEKSGEQFDSEILCEDCQFDWQEELKKEEWELSSYAHR